MKIKIPLFCAIIVSVMAMGCNSPTPQDSNHAAENENAQTTSVQESSLSFEEYEGLVKKFSSGYQYPNMKKVSDPLDSPLVVIVEKESTFGTRETLTLSGDAKDTRPQPTQNRFVYENSTDGYVLYIDLIYLKKYIGNDMVSSEISPSRQLDQKEKLNRISNNILSYRNILIELTLISTNNTNNILKESNDITNSVVRFLQEKQVP